MQQLLLFVEPTEEAWSTPKKISKLFMNRFSINEQSAIEVTKILKLKKTKEAENYHTFHLVDNKMIKQKENFDMDVIDTGLQYLAKVKAKDLTQHFIYAGNHYHYNDETKDSLRNMFLTKMKKYGFEFAMLTMTYLGNYNLVTKETMIAAYKGNKMGQLEFTISIRAIETVHQAFVSVGLLELGTPTHST